MSHSIYHVPSEVVEQFLAIGAVQFSYETVESRRWMRETERDPWTDIIYFWNAAGQELGYCSIVNPTNPIIFTPPYRIWHTSFLDRQIFHDFAVIFRGKK